MYNSYHLIFYYIINSIKKNLLIKNLKNNGKLLN